MSLEKLTNRTRYECWSLNKLADITDLSEPGFKTTDDLLEEEPTRDIQPNGTPRVSFSAHFGGESGQEEEVIRSLWPMLFVSSYKCIDVFIEWLLEESGREPENGRWTYAEKAGSIHEDFQSNNLSLPSPLDTHTLIAKKVFKLYANLADHRHAIIHRDDFEVTQEQFIVRDEDGDVYRFSEEELFSLGKLATGCIEVCRSGSFDLVTERQLKHYLDDLDFVHSMGEHNLTSHRGYLLYYPLQPTGESPLTWSPNPKKIEKGVITAVEGDDYWLHFIGQKDGQTVAEWLIPGDEWDNSTEIELTPDSTRFSDFKLN